MKKKNVMKRKNTVSFIGLLIALTLLTTMVLLTACSHGYNCSDGTITKNEKVCAEHLENIAMQKLAEAQKAAQNTTNTIEATSLGQETDQNQTEMKEKEDTTTGSDTGAYDPAVKALLDKHKEKIKSLSFTYTTLEVKDGQLVSTTTNRYNILGDKVRVDIPVPKKYDKETFIDTAYLDLSTKSARGFCSKHTTIVCPINGEERNATFSDYNIKYPDELFETIPASAESKGSRDFENRNAYVVRWNDGATYYEAYIDSFTGALMKYVSYSSSDYRDIHTISGVIYQDIATNSLNPEDVTP